MGTYMRRKSTERGLKTLKLSGHFFTALAHSSQHWYGVTRMGKCADYRLAPPRVTAQSCTGDGDARVVER